MGKTKFLRYAFMALTFAACLTGCSDDPQDDAQNFPQGGGEPAEGILLDLNVTVPGIESAVTRSLDARDESTVNTLDVLVFGRTGNEKSDEDPFLYHVTPRPGPSGSSGSSGSSSSSYQVTLKQSDTPVYLVLIANARQVVTGKLSEMAGKNKGQVLSMLTFDTSQPWPQSGDARYLPMWGESAATTITSGTATNALGKILLLRAVARIDVGVNFVNDDTAGEGEKKGSELTGNKFKIKKVLVYNTQNKSQIAPESENLKQGSLSEVVRPSLATGAELNKSAIAYELQSAGLDMVRTIYTGEALNDSNQTNTQVGGQINAGDVCIVVGGYFTPQDGAENTTEITYYRINLVKTKDASGNATAYHDLLRNFRYRVNITNVYGKGFNTPEDAYNAGPVNIETDMVAWNEGQMEDVVYDGQYQLSVTPREMTFYRNPHEQPVKIFATHPDGWKIVSKPQWISVSPENGSGNMSQPQEIKMNVTEAYYGDKPREGEIMIQAGNLTMRAKVQQTNQVEMSIEVDKNTLTFRKTVKDDAAQKVVVTFYPYGTNPGNTQQKYEPKAVHTDASTKKINWGSGFATISDNDKEQGRWTFTFKPESRNGTNLQDVLSSVCTFVLEDQMTGQIVTKTITIMQLASDLMLLTEMQNPYPAKGGDQTFKARADVKWKITKVTTQADGSQESEEAAKQIVTKFDKEEHPASDQMIDYTFTLEPQNSWAARKVYFHPTSEDGGDDFTTIPVEVEQAAAQPELILKKIGTEEVVEQIDLGQATTPGDMELDVWSNAKFAFTMPDGEGKGQGNVVRETHPWPSTTYMGEDSYLDPKKQSLRDNNKSLRLLFASKTATAGTEAAGTKLSTTLTFKYPEDTKYQRTKELVVTRTIPVFFSNFAFKNNSDNTTLTLKPEQSQFTVTAATNAYFQVSADNLDTKSYDAEAYGTKEITFDIKNAAGAWSREKYELKASYGVSSTDELKDFETRLNVERQGYQMTEAYIDPWGGANNTLQKLLPLGLNATYKEEYRPTFHLKGYCPRNLPIRLAKQTSDGSYADLVRASVDGEGTAYEVNRTPFVTLKVSEVQKWDAETQIAAQYQQVAEGNSGEGNWVTVRANKPDGALAENWLLPSYYMPKMTLKRTGNQIVPYNWGTNFETAYTELTTSKADGKLYIFHPQLTVKLYAKVNNNLDNDQDLNFTSTVNAAGTVEDKGQTVRVTPLTREDWGNGNYKFNNEGTARQYYVKVSGSAPNGSKEQTLYTEQYQQGKITNIKMAVWVKTPESGNLAIQSTRHFYVANGLAKTDSGAEEMYTYEAYGYATIGDMQSDQWLKGEVKKGNTSFSTWVGVCKNYQDAAAPQLNGRWRLPTRAECLAIESLCTCRSHDVLKYTHPEDRWNALDHRFKWTPMTCPGNIPMVTATFSGYGDVHGNSNIMNYWPYVVNHNTLALWSSDEYSTQNATTYQKKVKVRCVADVQGGDVVNTGAVLPIPFDTKDPNNTQAGNNGAVTPGWQFQWR